MKTKFPFTRHIACGVLFAGVASAALAHSGATGLVKERMVAMSAMGDAIKSVAPMMRVTTPTILRRRKARSVSS